MGGGAWEYTCDLPMDAGKDLEKSQFKNPVTGSRGFAVFLVLLSAWSLYSNIRHASARFHIPHHFVANYELFGRFGWAMDLLLYIGIVFLLFGFVTSTRIKIEMALFIGWVGPIVINPARMFLPRYTSEIWWVELCLTLVFFMTSIVVFLRLIRRRALPDSSSDSDHVPRPL
jgi:hypothetical protein